MNITQRTPARDAAKPGLQSRSLLSALSPDLIGLKSVKTTTPRIPGPKGRAQRRGGGALTLGRSPRGFESEVAGEAAMAALEEKASQVTSGAGSGTRIALRDPRIGWAPAAAFFCCSNPTVRSRPFAGPESPKEAVSSLP